MGATSYIAQCRGTQTSENCVPKGRDMEKCQMPNVSFGCGSNFLVFTFYFLL